MTEKTERRSLGEREVKRAQRRARQGARVAPLACLKPVAKTGRWVDRHVPSCCLSMTTSITMAGAMLDSNGGDGRALRTKLPL